MIRNNFTPAVRRIAICAFAGLLSAAIPQPSFAKAPSDGAVWMINLEKSKFGPRSNTLVVDRARQPGKMTAPAIAADGNPTAGAFLVIFNGKVYFASADAAYVSSENGLRTIDYTRWRDMKVEQIGDHVRSADHCGFRCQSGLLEKRRTLTFTTKGTNPMVQQAATMVAYGL